MIYTCTSVFDERFTNERDTQNERINIELFVWADRRQYHIGTCFTLK